MTSPAQNIRYDYVVIGNPVEHSLSPQIHQAFAAQTGENLSYGLLSAPLDDFAGAADRFFSAGGLGANVTVPFKAAAAQWVDELDDAAAFAGAVNTIVPQSSDRFRGYNTDGPGLLADLRRGFRASGLRDLKILVLGAGGAVRGVLGILADQQPASLTIANRTAAKAVELAADLRARFPQLAIAGVSLDQIQGNFDLVINGTSAGLADSVADVPGTIVQNAFCYDMVYGAHTPFCRWAADHGAAATLDGLGMLVEQAAAAFFLWRGKQPDVASVLDQLRAQRQRR